MLKYYFNILQRGRLECVEWLVQHSACVRDRMTNPSSRSSKGSNLNGQGVQGGRTLLHEAAKYGKVSCIPQLVFYGPTPASFFVYFQFFQSNIFTTNQCEKCPSSILRCDLNPQPLDQGSRSNIH